MNANYRLPLMLATSAALGAALITGLKAQVKPPVYVVIDISEMSDPATFAKGISALPPLASGERFVIRTTKAVPLDGAAPPNRFVAYAFDTEEKAKAWYASPAITEMNAIRMKTTKSRAFMVEGVAN
jgi:uncharacterized protein (DUF1330 family)